MTLATTRDPENLLVPRHLGALKPTRLSFARSLMSRMLHQRWQIERVRFALDERGCGEALYRVHAPGWVLDFVVFGQELVGDAERTDRIIGRRWDMYAALLEGEATAERVEQTRRELPKLYAGRAAPRTLVWARSNRSARLFEHVVASLSAGRQPDVEHVVEVGYLMRNTGLDANGTFGTRSFLAYEPDHPVRGPYHGQMLAAYLMREYGYDLAEHVARSRSRRAVPLHPAIRRYLGVGNSSGLGLVLWVNAHPRLVDRWLGLRERALTIVKAKEIRTDMAQPRQLLRWLDRSIAYNGQDRTRYEHFTPAATIARDLVEIRERLLAVAEPHAADGAAPPTWAAFCAALPAHLDCESLETFHALLIEVYPEVADALDLYHVAPEALDLIPEMSTGELRASVHGEYRWALRVDMAAPSARHYFWYKSAEAEEPRRGERDGVVPGVDLALDLPGDAQRLDADLVAVPERTSVAAFLARYPAHRWTVQRLQGLAGLAYHSPRMNMLDRAFVPAHVIRLVNASFYGLEKTQDVSERWVRGIIHHGAPLPEEIAGGTTDDWMYPPAPQV